MVAAHSIFNEITAYIIFWPVIMQHTVENNALFAINKLIFWVKTKS
jgi:hypothetical protein